jgi:curved DNA-binding protein CbpA
LARWQELAQLYDRLDELNHYQLLHVDPNAAAADISGAYFGLVKKFHPDRLPEALSPLGGCAQLIFERLTEASETLGNADLRAEYGKAVAAGGGTRASERMMRAVLESALEYQKAEVLTKRRDYPQAMELIQSALAKNKDEGDYHALHGWLLHLMHPGDAGPTDVMLREFDFALKANPKNERAHYYKGVVLKRLNRLGEAARHFRTAAEINPRNVDAAREVRLSHMRRDSKPPPDGAGSSRLLSKLFKGGKDS